MERSATEARQPARRSGIRLSLAAALSAALLAGCAAGRSGPLLLHPVPLEHEQYSLSQGAIVFSGPDFRVAVRPWDYRLVAEEFRRSGESCPFGTDDAQVGRFIFFRVLLENRSGSSLVFNPMRASILRQGEAPLVPFENSDLFSFAGEEMADAEARGLAFRRTCFDGAVTLRPGQSLERYLVFRTPEDPGRQIVLELDDLWLAAKSFDLLFVFEAFPGE